MRALWSGVIFLLLLQSCTQQSLPVSTQAGVTTPVPYLSEISKFDNPDYVMQTSSAVLNPIKPSRITPRFTNTDRSHRLGAEFNYFNGELDSIGVYEYTGDVLSRYVLYNGPGDDGVWQTADDVMAGYHDHAPTLPNVITILYKGSGADQTWYTADDEILYYHAVLLDGAGKEIGTATYTLPGDDEIWFTEDDFIGWLTTENTVANETQWIMYFSAGTDNNWRTLDDNDVIRFALTILDDAGLKQRYSYFEGVGGDNLPFTADDDLVY